VSTSIAGQAYEALRLSFNGNPTTNMSSRCDDRKTNHTPHQETAKRDISWVENCTVWVDETYSSGDEEYVPLRWFCILSELEEREQEKKPTNSPTS
jgi:hypothetical protein